MALCPAVHAVCENAPIGGKRTFEDCEALVKLTELLRIISRMSPAAVPLFCFKERAYGKTVPPQSYPDRMMFAPHFSEHLMSSASMHPVRMRLPSRGDAASCHPYYCNRAGPQPARVM